MEANLLLPQCSGPLQSFLKRTLISAKEEMAHWADPPFFLILPKSRSLCREAGIYYLSLSPYALFKEVAKMKIKENITATLEREMDKRGLNCGGLSAAIDFPRTTLQGYLKGTSHPRADSIEELANKLGLSAAELVSGEDYPGLMRSSDFGQSLSAIPTLHPLVRPLARQTVSLLNAIFQMSEKLYGIESPDAATPRQDSAYKYCLHELWNPFRHTLSYGIRVQENWSTVALAAPLSSDRDTVLDLVDHCNQLQLSPEHLFDVAQDFLTQQALTT